MLLCCIGYLKRNSKMKNNEQHIIPFIERLLDGTEVEWKKLGEVVQIEKGQRVTKQELSSDKQYPVYSGGVKPMGYYDKYNQEADTITMVKYGTAGYVNFITEKFWANDVCYCIKPKANLDNKFLLYALRNIQVYIYSLATEAIPAHLPSSSLASIQIPIPPLSVQQEIVRILDKFTTLEAELEAELDCRKRQYEYYRNKLLSFNMLNGGGNSLNNIFILPLGEVGEFVRGSGLQKKDFTPAGVGCIHYGQIYTYYGTYAYKTKSFVSQKFAQKARKAKYGDLIIATTSENDEDVCKAVVWLGNEDIAVSSDACFYTHKMNPKYVAYYFQTEQFQRQKRKFITGAKVRRVNANDLAKIKIPIPPLSEQERIVSILDKFDTLTNSISEGLPKEIKLRRKQYEYYREQLLSFRH